MIVGNGDIAKMLIARKLDHPDFVFFASGVSNSQCVDKREFEREARLLRTQNRERHLVYFSSLSVYYSTSAYANHKYEMEMLIRAFFDCHTIIRLGNIAWGTNPHTLLNVLRERGGEIALQDTIRYVVTPDLFCELIARATNDRVREINVWRERLTVAEIWERIKRGEL